MISLSFEIDTDIETDIEESKSHAFFFKFREYFISFCNQN